MKSGLALVVAALLLVIGTASVSFSQSPDDIKTILRELAAIKASQAALQKEVAELKNLVQRPAAPAAAPVPRAIGATVSLAGAPYRGRADAPLTLIEFSDFQCPFCARHVRETMPQLENEYISTGKLKYVFRHMPIESLHPNAFKAAEAAACANETGNFWPLHDRLFANQTTLAANLLPGHATAVGLDGAAIQQCVASGKHTMTIRKDLNDGAALGINGTPAFVLGRTIAGSQTIKVDAFIYGAQTYASFKFEIDKLLK